jgi:hypothetical protein
VQGAAKLPAHNISGPLYLHQSIGFSQPFDRAQAPRTSFKTRLRLFEVLIYKCKRDASEGFETLVATNHRI